MKNRKILFLLTLVLALVISVTVCGVTAMAAEEEAVATNVTKIAGDVNGDGDVNTADTTLIRRYIAGYDMGSNFDVTVADVNADGDVNTADTTLVRRFIAGYNVTLVPPVVPEPPVEEHTLTAVEAKAATCLEAGNIAYWECTECGKLFSDEAATTEITIEQTVVPIAGHTDDDSDYVCDVCGAEITQGHQHTYTDWIYGNNGHWKEYTCDCAEELGRAFETPHNYDETDLVCLTCGYDCDAEGHEHEFESDWTITEDEHWKASICGHKYDFDQLGKHADEDGDAFCDVCNVEILDPYDPTEKYETYNWDTATIYVCLNENSNNQELSSELRRYLAGDTSTDEYVDELVAERNAAALATAKVNVIYTYWGEGDTHTTDDPAKWGQTITRTVELVMANAPGSPDIYVNQIYDMVSASLQKCFANIRTTKMSGGDNNFSFMEQEFVDYANAYGKEWGYMMEYMTELGFSVKKQYLIASDYFIDLVRAFFVVPMNLNLLSYIDIDSSTGDRDNDEDFDVDDFYKMVMAGEWTYDTLVQYSNAIYSNISGIITGSMDDLNGFILTPSNGMICSALLYTSSVKVFSRELNEATGFYECSYPDTNEDLFAFCDALKAMVDTEGVYVERVDHLKIRDSFTSDMCLFGGIILLGSLEYQDYQNMKNQSGFGILPVPVYREGDQYLTLIHNMGRIAGIAATTTEFAQCSAYLDYQSTHSTEILNEYYEYKMQYDTAGGTAGNIEILNYIRNHVRSAFDKTYEDAIGFYFKDVDKQESWAGILSASDFACTTMRDKYITNKTERAAYLEDIIKAYDSLPE